MASAIEEPPKARGKKPPVTHTALTVGKRHAGVRKGDAGERKTPGAAGPYGKSVKTSAVGPMMGGGTLSGMGAPSRFLLIQQETPSTKNSSNVCSPMVNNAAV